TLQAITKAIFKGIFDSLRGTIVLFYLDRNIKERALQETPVKTESSLKKGNESSPAKQVLKSKSEPKILKRTLQCCALNGGVFWLSILLFEYCLLPAVKYVLNIVFGHSPQIGKSVWSLIHTFLNVTFGALWVVPLFFLSKVVNSLWFQDIADSAYRYSRGRPQVLSSFGKLVADALFSVLVQFLFLLQSILVSSVPVSPVGYLLSLVHMCMLYSLYAFEYKWYNMGWELHKRLNYIEANWPYFIGFGLPLAVLTGLTSSYIIRYHEFYRIVLQAIFTK
ncbi:hypothetical protein AAG570_006418, partial [Ranatra chinensis]